MNTTFNLFSRAYMWELLSLSLEQTASPGKRNNWKSKKKIKLFKPTYIFMPPLFP